jgi:hypothetical protein
MAFLSIRSAFLWGAALSIAAFVPAAQAGRHYQILHSFSSSEGSAPTGDLIFDAAGNLYGTLGTGGANRNGAIFKLSAAGISRCFIPLPAEATEAGPRPVWPSIPPPAISTVRIRRGAPITPAASSS